MESPAIYYTDINFWTEWDACDSVCLQIFRHVGCVWAAHKWRIQCQSNVTPNEIVLCSPYSRFENCFPFRSHNRVWKFYLCTIDDRRSDDDGGSVKLLRRSRLLLFFFGCELFFTDSRKKLLQKLRRRVRFASFSTAPQSSGDRKFMTLFPIWFTLWTQFFDPVFEHHVPSSFRTINALAWQFIICISSKFLEMNSPKRQVNMCHYEHCTPHWRRRFINMCLNTTHDHI